ncbi:MAG TPA: HAD family phosphatase [Solirubrobacteraceae bacterium]|jgi:2-haloacid dehalogenase|nr:HAD family phosphatase [Solirubrobacteraceae bacterium]
MPHSEHPSPTGPRDTRRRSIEAVVFDIGGVLLDWNPRYLYRKLFDDEEAMEWFLAEICTLTWHEANDLGVPFEVSCGELAARHPDYAERIWAWGRRSEEMVAGPISGTVEILRELRRRSVPCYALTNMEAETYPRRLERYEFLRWFDGTVVSSAEGIAKPDARIFHLLMERFGLAAESTLLIDDSERNIEAAEKLGMQTMRFESPEDLRRRLVEVGLLDRGSATVGRSGPR